MITLLAAVAVAAAADVSSTVIGMEEEEDPTGFDDDAFNTTATPAPTTSSAVPHYVPTVTVTDTAYDVSLVRTLTIFCVVVHILGVAFCALCMISLICNWNNPIIKISQPRKLVTYCSVLFCSVLFFRTYFFFRLSFSLSLDTIQQNTGFLVIVILGATMESLTGIFLIAAANKSVRESHEFSRYYNDDSIMKFNHFGENRKDDPDFFYDCMCMSWVWFFTFGHVFVYMGLFGKLRRIAKVAQIRSRHASPVSIWYGMWPLHIMRGLTFVLLVTWFVFAIPEYVSIGYGDNVDDNEFGICDYRTPAQLVFLIPLGTIIIVSAMLGAHTAYRIRDTIPNELSDVNQIFHVYMFQIFSLITFGTMYVVGRSFAYLSVCVLGLLFLAVFSSVTSIGPIMIPKMYYIWYKRKYGHLPDGVHMMYGQGTVHVNINTNTNTNGQNNNNNNNPRTNDNQESRQHDRTTATTTNDSYSTNDRCVNDNTTTTTLAPTTRI